MSYRGLKNGQNAALSQEMRHMFASADPLYSKDSPFERELVAAAHRHKH